MSAGGWWSGTGPGALAPRRGGPVRACAATLRSLNLRSRSSTGSDRDETLTEESGSGRGPSGRGAGSPPTGSGRGSVTVVTSAARECALSRITAGSTPARHPRGPVVVTRGGSARPCPTSGANIRLALPKKTQSVGPENESPKETLAMRVCALGRRASMTVFGAILAVAVAGVAGGSSGTPTGRQVGEYYADQDQDQDPPGRDQLFGLGVDQAGTGVLFAKGEADTLALLH